MTEIQKTTFTPRVGAVVELPTEIGRKDCYRYGGGNGANGHLGATVVGTGGTTEYVVLRFDDDETTLPEGAEILGADVYQDTVWYAVPRSAYGGGE